MTITTAPAHPTATAPQRPDLTPGAGACVLGQGVGLFLGWAQEDTDAPTHCTGWLLAGTGPTRYSAPPADWQPTQHADAPARAETLARALADQQPTLLAMDQHATDLQRQITDWRNRWTKLWQDANEAADEHDWCSVYDELAQEHGGPERTRDLEVSVRIDAEVTITLTLPRSDELCVSDLDLTEVLDQLTATGLTSHDVRITDY